MKPGKSEKSGEGEAPRKHEDETRQHKPRKRPGDSSNRSNQRTENNGAYRFHRRIDQRYFDIPYTGPGGYQMPDHMAQFLYSPPPPPPPPESNPNPPPKVYPAATSQPKYAASSQPHPYPAAPLQQHPPGRNMNGAWLPPFHHPGYRPVPYPNIAPGWWNSMPPGQFLNNVPVNQLPAPPPYPYPHPMGPLPQGPYVHQGPPRYGQGFNIQQPDFIPVFRPKPRKPPIEDNPPCVECGIGLVQEQVRDLLVEKQHEKFKKTRRRKERAAAAAQQDAMAKNVAIVRDEFGRLLKDSVRDVLVRRRDRLRDQEIEPEPHRRAIQLEYPRSKTPVAITQDLFNSLERGRALEQADLTLQQITDLISRTRGLELSQSPRSGETHGDADDEHQKYLDYLQAQIDWLGARTASYERRPAELIMSHPTYEDAGFAEARQQFGRAHSQPPRGRQNDRYFMVQRVRAPRSHSRRKHQRPQDYSSSTRPDLDIDDNPIPTWEVPEHNRMVFPEPRIRRKYRAAPRKWYQYESEETVPSTYEDGVYSDSYDGPPELRPRVSRRYFMRHAPEVPEY
ncbi:hypothetical protein CKAH01_17676 [Colletotrichum kahawae]|uniref:Uncharacterized protein n=1 Tax=Colletotrichum kahawae TaxID=34407 RepID=A0AAE0D412_COLKA|nr:hypothetical protein CKAH01_17676 [Colletotrichum kahawae]